MALDRLTTDVAYISKLDNYPSDDPGMTPDKLKSLFDQGSVDIKNFLNNKLIPQIEGLLAQNGGNGEGSGDMVRAVYDPDGDGIVKAADVAYSVDWSNVQGRPVIPTALADLEQDSSHRTVTDAEKAAWNSKQDALGFTPVPNTRKVNGKALSSDITLDAADIGAVPTTRKVNNKALSQDITLSASDVGAIPASQKGTANGVAELDANGKVPSFQLPSYVDEVLEYDNLSSFPSTGETGKIYLALDTNKTYRWSGSSYVEISPSIALGETASTAYRGDRGKIAYDHSQTTGNPHGTTPADIGAVPTTRKINNKALSDDISLTAADVGAIPVSLKGVAYGVAELDETGKVPISQLPSYGWAEFTDTVYARFVVGTSTAGWTEEDCDYLCDGTNDQEEIIQALNALPATGGEVVILDGTYNITASINIPKDNVSLRGNGNATTLKRMYNSTNADSGPTAKGLITLNEKSGCKIQGLQIDGNKATYTATYNCGIFLYSSSNNTVTGNTCNNNNNDGIRLQSSSSNNIVTDNICNNNSSGIYLYSSSSDNTVTSNTCNNNNYSGISLFYSSNNTITGNTCNNNSSDGIMLFSTFNNTVTGNTCNNNNCGIYLSSSSNNTVTGNTCIRGTGTPEDYTTSQYTIFLSGTDNNYNLISSNNCMGKAVVIEGGTGNSAWGNKFDNTDDLPYGEGSGDDYMPKSGGTFTGIVTAQSNTSYTTPQIRNIVLSVSDPSGGNNGEIWIKYQ